MLKEVEGVPVSTRVLLPDGPFLRVERRGTLSDFAKV